MPPDRDLYRIVAPSGEEQYFTEAEMRRLLSLASSKVSQIQRDVGANDVEIVIQSKIKGFALRNCLFLP